MKSKTRSRSQVEEPSDQHLPGSNFSNNYDHIIIQTVVWRVTLVLSSSGHLKQEAFKVLLCLQVRFLFSVSVRLVHSKNG